MSMNGFLTLMLLPYVQSPIKAPYSLEKTDALSWGRLETGLYQKPKEGEHFEGAPVLEFGAEFYRQSSIPLVKVGMGVDFLFPSVRIRFLPSIVFSMGDAWDGAPQGGRYYRFLASALWAENSYSGEIFYRGFYSGGRNLDDPEDHTRMKQDGSEILGLRVGYNDLGQGFFAGLKGEYVKLGSSMIEAPGFGLELEASEFFSTDLQLGWRKEIWAYSIKGGLMSGDTAADGFAYNARGAFEDKYLSPRYIELEVRCDF